MNAKELKWKVKLVAAAAGFANATNQHSLLAMFVVIVASLYGDGGGGVERRHCRCGCESVSAERREQLAEPTREGDLDNELEN